jgi:hypothetical protein
MNDKLMKIRVKVSDNAVNTFEKWGQIYILMSIYLVIGQHFHIT